MTQRVGQSARVVRPERADSPWSRDESVQIAVSSGLADVNASDAERERGIRARRLYESKRDGDMRLSDLFRLPAEVRDRILSRLLLSEKKTIVALPETQHSSRDLGVDGAVLRDVLRDLEALLDAAWRSGHLTREAAAKLERRCDRAISVLAGIRELARVAVREGVISARAK